MRHLDFPEDGRTVKANTLIPIHSGPHSTAEKATGYGGTGPSVTPAMVVASHHAGWSFSDPEVDVVINPGTKEYSLGLDMFFKVIHPREEHPEALTFSLGLTGKLYNSQREASMALLSDFFRIKS